MVRYALLFALLAPTAGCGPSKAAIESSIREEMKKSMAVDISAIVLTKLPDGGYTGTATATNGDQYDLEVSAPSGNRAEWKAFPGQATLEKQIRKQVATQTGMDPTSVALTKGGSVGVFTGAATLPNGQRLSVRTYLQGNQVMSELLPMK